MATKKAKAFDLEQSLLQLEKITLEMETGDIKLEDSLRLYEQAVGTIKLCEEALTQASLKVQILSEKNGKLSAKDFEIKDDS